MLATKKFQINRYCDFGRYDKLILIGFKIYKDVNSIMYCI